MKRECAVFFAALRFFTRLPVPAWVGHSAQQLEQASRYLPLIGALVGGLGAAVTLAVAAALPLALAILAGMAATVLLTGALHEDGFADAVDGFGGAQEPARVLEIMRDSRIGSFGAVAVALLLLAKFQALAELGARGGPAALVPALIAAHALSRLAAAALMSTLDYVRVDEHAKARPLARRLSAPSLLVAGLCGLVPCLFVAAPGVWVALGLAALLTFLAARYFVRRIGGYTGDCLGATQQLAELAFYCGLLCVST